MKASVFFLGLTTGAITAAVTVLYSTPKSGNEIRKSVKTVGTDWKDYFHDLKIKMNHLSGSIGNLNKEPNAEKTETKDSFTERTKNILEKELREIQDTLHKLEQSILS